MQIKQQNLKKIESKIYVKGIKNIIKKEINQGKILDIGCGSGENYELLKTPETEIYLLDIQDLRTVNHGLFVKGNGCTLPFKSNCFDAVVSFDVIEHVPDDLRFIGEAVRVTKRRGKVIIGTPNRDRLSNRIRSFLGKKIIFPKSYGKDPILGEILHLREYTNFELKDIIEKSTSHEVKANVEGILLGLYIFGDKGQGLSFVPSMFKQYAHHLVAIIEKF